MCGICGVMSNKMGLPEVMKFKDLMVLAQLRGDDGSGALAVTHKHPTTQSEVRVRRTTWSSGHLVTTSDFDELVKGDTDILIGHARQPTRGGTKLEMVHPHRAGQVYLVHNGTMTYIDDKAVGTNESDSKMIARSIEANGIQEFVNKAFGAFCLVWVDLRDQSLNFLRNDQRPLSFCEEKVTSISQGYRTLYWASEMLMLQMALGRYSGYSKERFTFRILPVNEHWKFSLKPGHEIQPPEVTKVERVYKSSYTSSVYHSWEDFDDQLPFVGSRQSNTQSTNSGGSQGSSGSSARAVVTTNGFKYTPPEYRQPGHNPWTPPVTHAGTVITNSRLEAERATNAMRVDAARLAALENKGKPDPAEPFPLQAEFDKYVCSNRVRALDLVTKGPCVWCEEKPTVISGQDLRIYPVKFGEGREDYVCQDCMADLDVRRMVGMA